MTTKFSVQVAQHLIQENLGKGKNTVCSPASIDAILSTVAFGAVNETQEQLLTLLDQRDIPELKAASSKLVNVFKAPETSYANALWLDQSYSLNDEFEIVLREIHNAHVKVVDFVNQADQVVNEANELAKEATNGLIKQILRRDNIKGDTVLLLANALYFKGAWQKPFLSKNTITRSFNRLDGVKVRVPFMRQACKYYDYGTYNDCQVIRMPYKCASEIIFSMYVFLPFEKDGLPNVMENIKIIDQNMFQDEIKLEYVMVDKLSIPKFKFESDIDLKNTMKQFGMTLPFEENCMDFSGIADSTTKPLFVSDIFQKSCVELNEKGTTAATVSRGIVATCGRRTGPPPPEIKFVADHPFMFVIKENVSGAILFVGTMLDPKQKL
ncbi:serpin-Z10-like [Silene latifolia]|uniref:serpin-Z10-like n=1 Tax=Silene latifolia TaxID=37657 RepID=UPI003D789513